MMHKPKVAFICIHNSCRSQIAEALGKKFALNVFDSFSGGTEPKDQLNQDAVRLMKQTYQIDMEKDQFSKSISFLPPIDIVVTMGCHVSCPTLPCNFREDWGLEDPTGGNDDVFLSTIKKIEYKILDLKSRIEHGE